MDAQEAEAMRRREVTFAIRVAAGTPLAPDAHELALLEAYVRGQLSLAQLLERTNQYLASQELPEDS